MRLSGLAILFSLTLCPAVFAEDATVKFTIDATRDVKPISRFIYGVNRKLEGDWANLPLTRFGGNRLTAYNWTNNASNAGNDWQYQNDSVLSNTDATAAAIVGPIENASANHAGIVITVPINGYVAADKNGGGDVRKSGEDYLKTRFHPEQPAKGSAFTLTPDPKSAVVFQDEFVNWIKSKYSYGETDPLRPIFFCLDNEPDLWQSTHKEVHPDAVTYGEIAEKSIAYAKAIKSVSPKAKIFGPVNYGWQGYRNLQNAPDAKGRDFQEFYLAEMKAAEAAAHKRLLDVLDIHWYPEAQGDRKRIVTPESSAGLIKARVQAPRSLWDPSYTEDSWITKSSTHGAIALLPRMQKKIDANYPGTLLAMTEYNYGGGGHISGAIAEADVLGIFGREAVFAAAEWPMAKDESFIAGALKMFRNFDGKEGAFGDTSVLASTGDAEATSIYASLDAKNRNRMVLIAINKTADPITADVAIEHAGRFTSSRTYQLTDESATPHAGEAVNLKEAGHFQYAMPGYSVSTIELTAK